MTKKLNTDDHYRKFKVTRVVEVPELQCQLRELVHEPTGAQVMHIENDDPENLFCLSFRTLPETSNGVAHILEHTVLCGSEKFPVKDPFFAMTRRSLNTFMNAMTGQDFTCYPAATQVTKDFYNLLEVYLDSVFKPKLEQLSFLQEGHRLELIDGELEYKGVVYNEMKGAMTSPNERLSELLNRSLYPDLTYRVNSGGDPKVIPELTYEQLLAFHKTYYHPSRCLFFFYGNMPLEGHLDFIEKHALSGVSPKKPIPQLPRQKRFKAPVRITDEYPIAPDETLENKTHIAMGWLTCHILEQEDLLALSVLDIILMGTDASPLKLALLKSGLCTQAGSFLDEDISEAPFVITMRGCDPDNADKLESLVRTTLETITKEGIPSHIIESAIHQLEFYRSEITGNRYPYGLMLFMRSALLKQHNGKPENALMVHSLFDQLRKNINNNPDYLSRMIKKYFLENLHFTRVVMKPSKKLADQELEEEKTALASIKEKLTQEEQKKVIAQAEELSTFQKKQEDQNLEVLPKVTLADVPKKSRDYTLNREKIGNLEVFSHHCFTNNIVYADVVFPLPKIAADDLSFVSLFTTLLPEVGCGGRDYRQNLEYIQENTGGIGLAPTLNLQAVDCQQLSPCLHVKGKALHRKAEKLFPLLFDILQSADFTDTERLKELIDQIYTGLMNKINQNAMKYAINLSASGVSLSSHISNLWYGLDFFWRIKELAENWDSQAHLLIEKMQKLQQHLLGLEGAHLVLTCTEQMANEIKGQQFYGLDAIPTKPFDPWEGNYKVPEITPQGRTIASPVAFTGKVFPTVSYVHPHSAALCAGSCIFDKKTLHPLIREQGGAYGGGASNNALGGKFTFFAYRDPNLFSTLSAFEKAIDDVIAGQFNDHDVEEAKLEIIQGLDTPVAPGSRGTTAYSWWREGKTLDIRQNFRDQLLKLGKDDIIKATKDHIQTHMNEGKTVTFASKELLERENERLKESGKETLKILTV